MGAEAEGADRIVACGRSDQVLRARQVPEPVRDAVRDRLLSANDPPA
jgi:hypothetical protein